MNLKKIIVISAVNLIEGGTLTILKQCLAAISQYIVNHVDYKVIAIVHKKELCYFQNIEYIEIPIVKKRYIYRLFYEYVYSFFLSTKIKPYFWFSLHDISPNIINCRRAVYCHNPSPFYKRQSFDMKYDKTLFLFSLFYRFLYEFNIKKNTYVVVQQEWMKKEFEKLFFLNSSQIIVSYPPANRTIIHVDDLSSNIENLFFYPSIPRPFKNFHVICEAVKVLNEWGVANFTVTLTLDGSETKYSKWLYEKYKDVPNLDFVGLLTLTEVYSYYQKSKCLIFPSKLETWGLPISEYSVFDKPIILSDLPYAYETSHGCEKLCFFNPNDATELAGIMKKVIDNDFLDFIPSRKNNHEDIFVDSWNKLFDVLFNE